MWILLTYYNMKTNQILAENKWETIICVIDEWWDDGNGIRVYGGKLVDLGKNKRN